MNIQELQAKKKELELRIKEFVGKEIVSFSEETGISVSKVEIPIGEMDFLEDKPRIIYMIVDTWITLDL